MCGRMIRIGSRVKFRSLQLDFGELKAMDWRAQRVEF